MFLLIWTKQQRRRVPARLLKFEFIKEIYFFNLFIQIRLSLFLFGRSDNFNKIFKKRQKFGGITFSKCKFECKITWKWPRLQHFSSPFQIALFILFFVLLIKYRVKWERKCLQSFAWLVIVVYEDNSLGGEY